MNYLRYIPVLFCFFWFYSSPSMAIHCFLENRYRNESCDRWVDSVMNTLDRSAKIGQLFMPIVSADGRGWPEKIVSWVENQQIGGLLFDKGDVMSQVLVSNMAQEKAKLPLLISADAEWGLAMRLKDTPCFPQNTTLAAISDTSLLYEYGRIMAGQCRRIGVQINFAPVADVNSNASNPVINTRAFGADPMRVAAYAAAYAAGMEEGGVMAVMKHFPGHGHTYEDSHNELAKIRHTRAEMDSLELYPFRYLIQQGISGAMVGHLSVPAIEPNAALPASQSSNVVNRLLKKDLGFEGLVFTDAMAMKGSSSSYSGLNCVRALLAGNDILLGSANLVSDIRTVASAVNTGTISDSLIDEKCRKVLMYKYILGLSEYRPIDTTALMKDLNSPQAESLNRRLHAQAMTLLRNEKNFLPFRELDKQKTAVVSLEKPLDNAFIQTLKVYQENVDTYILTEESPLDKKAFIQNLAAYDRVVVAVYKNNALQQEWVESLRPLKKLCFCFFISPYYMSHFGDVLDQANAVVCAYESTDLAQELAAQALFGGIPFNGKLPAPIVPFYRTGDGLTTEKTRLSYGIPEEAGLCSDTLALMDSIINDALAQGAFPGCQVLVAKNGRVVWNKSYGWTDSQKSRPVTNEDVYDLASLTKAIVCTPAVMSLCEREQIHLDDPLSEYLPELRKTDKESLTYRQMLYHESRLAAFLPFYQHLIDTSSFVGNQFLAFHPDTIHQMRFDERSYAPSEFRFLPSMVSSQSKDDFSLQVADGFYVRRDFRDTVLHLIARSELLKRKRYTYSDLGYILMGMSLERINGQALDDWAESELFAPLGAYTTTYHPLRKLPKSRIIPTASDTCLRKQILCGYPHDEAAAFMGGVAGNAGLFSNANDLAKYLQLLLELGTYGQIRYWEPSTVRYFTSHRSALSRRMLGFDAAETDKNKVNPVCAQASKQTYGHVGFTGTCFWIDPVNDLIYIFLSNRIHPDRTNLLLSRLDVRPKIQEVIYRAQQ